MGAKPVLGDGPGPNPGLGAGPTAGRSPVRLTSGGGGGGTGVRPDGRVGPGPLSATLAGAAVASVSSSGSATLRLIDADSRAATTGRSSPSPAAPRRLVAISSSGPSGINPGAPGLPRRSVADAALGGDSSETSKSSGSSLALGHFRDVSHVGSGRAAAMPRPPLVGRRMSPFNLLSSDPSTTAMWFGTWTPRSLRRVMSLAELTPSIFASSKTRILPSGKNLTPSSGSARCAHRTVKPHYRAEASDSRPEPDRFGERPRPPLRPRTQEHDPARAFPELARASRLSPRPRGSPPRDTRRPRGPLADRSGQPQPDRKECERPGQAPSLAAFGRNRYTFSAAAAWPC